MIADRAKKKLQSGQFREGRSGYRKPGNKNFFFFGLSVNVLLVDMKTVSQFNDLPNRRNSSLT